MRSKTPADPESFDGPYILSTTIEEGNRIGTAVPARRIAYSDRKIRIKRVLEIPTNLYQLLGPLSMSAFEWVVSQFHLEDNNVFTFGELHGGVSAQMNVSSGFNGGDLAK